MYGIITKKLNFQEDADALIGRVLVCASILHSNKIDNASDTEITKCIETLINASHYKFYHSSLAYTFLIELLKKLDKSQFSHLMWPQMQKELKRPWEKQNINTVHFLIKCQSKYPMLIDDEFLLASLHANEILTPSAYKHFSRLFWSPSSITIAATHPSYEALGIYLSANVPEKKLLEFWQKEINEVLLAPTKLKEISTLRLLITLFAEGRISPTTAIKLLSNPLIIMITKSVRNVRQQKQVDYTGSLYTKLFNSIEKYFQARSGIQESHKVKIIQRFIDYPGTLTIEKMSPNRMIHKFICQLKAEGVHQMFDFYKSILLDRKAKNPKTAEKWLHTEKEHCVQMIQTLLMQKSVHNDHEWRIEQLKFLLKYGLFHVDKKTDAITSRESGADELPSDIAYKLKQAFYTSLQMKTQNLEIERKSLISIVEFCNEQLRTKLAVKTLRHQLSEEAIQSWNKMFETVTARKKTMKISFNVFDVLMIHMGLHLFVDSNLAIFSINDLEKCIERAQNKIKVRPKKNSPSDDSSEAEWIEVVVDLFLQLLSQNKSFLRNIVDNVFPDLCKYLNASAIDQILFMLDMNEKNPLTPYNDADEENENSSDDDEESDDDNDEDSDSKDEESSEEENVTDEDEGTINDQLRSVISQALGSAAPETDTESIDLNDMDDEEASRLDSVLSEAFKSVRKNTSGGKKKTKLERTTNTAVLHFRIRVLDLIEIYLKTSPTLAITLNILTDLIPMYENCAGNKDLEPLTRRLLHVLKILYNLKEFSSTENVSEAKLYELFENIIEVKTNPSAFNEQNKLRSNICGFLITVSQLLKSKDQILLEAIAGCLEQFLKSRNPRVQFSSFMEILRTRWIGILKLGQIISKTILLEAEAYRPFRRSQAIELLTTIYKNHAFISNEIEEFNQCNKKIEAAIKYYIQWLKKERKSSSKEFTALLQLLQEVHKCSLTISEFECTLDWTKLCEIIQSTRRLIEVDSYQIYFAFCKRFGLKDIKNSEIQLKITNSKTVNGEHNGGNEGKSLVKPTNGVAKKRKCDTDNSESVDKRRAISEKKFRKHDRLKMSSVGLDDRTFNFARGNEDIEMD